MDTIGHISEFGDRGGLNGLRVSEENLIQHSKVPLETQEPTSVRRRVRFKGIRGEAEDMQSEEEEEQEEQEGQEGQVEPQVKSLAATSDTGESFWSKIQKWFRNNSKGALIISAIIAIIIVIVTIYVLKYRTTATSTAGIIASNHNTAKSLILAD